MRVVNKRKEPYDVYIGRGSHWGNPYRVEQYGRTQAIELYEKYITERLNNDPALVQELLALEHCTLGCFCKPKPCHGDVLVKLLKEYKEKNIKVIVAGGRDFNDADFMIDSINELLDSGKLPEPFTLICGMAKGADLLAHSILSDNDFPIEEYPANWNKYGKRAGFIRNEQMGDVADAAIIFWDGVSRGTRHMKEYMQKLGKPVYIFYYGDK